MDEEKIKIKMDDSAALFVDLWEASLVSETQNEIVELPCEG